MQLGLTAGGENGQRRLVAMRVVVRLDALLDHRLAEADDLQHAPESRPTADRRSEPRRQVRRDHPFQLVRHAGKNPDVLSALLDVKSRRGAALVVQRGLPDENVRLLFVDLGHLPAARGEARLESRDDRRIDFHLQIQRFGECLARQIVLGRTEAARGDEDLGVIEPEADLVGEIGQRVADDALPHDRDGERFERRGELERVCVEPRRPEHLGADGDDGCSVAGLLGC